MMSPLFFSLISLLFSSIIAAHPSMMKENDHYALTCPDGSLAVGKGLHACCEKEPNVYCVLCVLMSKGHVTTCTTDCNGTVVQTAPYCLDCLCKPPPLPEVNVEDGEEAYRGCPYLRRMKNQNKDL